MSPFIAWLSFSSAIKEAKGGENSVLGVLFLIRDDLNRKSLLKFRKEGVQNHGRSWNLAYYKPNLILKQDNKISIRYRLSETKISIFFLFTSSLKTTWPLSSSRHKNVQDDPNILFGITIFLFSCGRLTTDPIPSSLKVDESYGCIVIVWVRVLFGAMSNFCNWEEILTFMLNNSMAITSVTL